MTGEREAPKIGLFGFFAMTGSMILTVYSYPVFASSGFSLVFFLLFAATFFFVPTALISAEMATGKGWETGGVYKWCSVAFGERWGFFAIFLQWLQISVGFVTMLFFVAGALSYLFGWHAMEANPVVKFATIVAVFWLTTLINYRGTSLTARLSSIGLVAGVALPALVLIALVLVYLAGGNPVNVTIGGHTFFPDFENVHTWVILVAFILSCVGIEASAVHVNELENARRNYPIAVLVLTVFAVVMNILGGMSVAVVIPASDINMSSGVMQAFKILLDMHQLGWFVHVLALLLALGAVAEVSAWIMGPSQGLLVAAKDGILPPIFKRVNRHQVPMPLLIAQGAVVTIWAAILTFGGGGHSNLSFLLAIALTIVIYLSMYVLLFLTYFKLRISHGEVERSYHVPGGAVGKTLIPVVGLAMVLFSLVVSFFPPDQIMKANDGTYERTLLIAFVVVLLVPHIIFAFRKEEHREAYTVKRAREFYHAHFFHPRGRFPFRIHDRNP